MPKEVREDECRTWLSSATKQMNTFKTEQLKTTIIIPYLYEELYQIQYSLLSLLSLFLTTPPGLVEEIIIVDDGNPEKYQFPDKLT